MPPHLLAACSGSVSTMTVGLGPLQRDSLLGHLHGGTRRTCSLSKSLDLWLIRTFKADEVASWYKLSIRLCTLQIPGSNPPTTKKNQTGPPKVVLSAQLPGTPGLLFHSIFYSSLS